MDRPAIEARIREIMGHYRVNQKFRPTRTSGRNYSYAVYAGKNIGRVATNRDVKQVSGDLTSAEAKVFRDNLIVADIADFIESLKESNNHVHEE